MNKKTLITFIVFFVLLGAVFIMLNRPEKGDRSREKKIRPIAKIMGDSVKQLTITKADKTAVLVRDEKMGWKMTQPVAYAADKNAVDAAVERLVAMEFGDLVTELAAKHAEHQVDDKSAIHVVASDGSKTLADFLVGKVESDFTLVRPAGQNQVYQVISGQLRSAFDRDIKMWRNREIISFKQEDARELAVVSSEGKATFTRPESKDPWKVKSSEPAISTLDDATLANLLTSLSSLNATDFADGKNAAQTGLEKPDTTITVTMADKKQHMLLIGQAEKENFYVQPKGSPQIYLVEKGGIANLRRRPVDFNDKTIFKFAATDVVGMNITKPADKATLKITKKGDDWLANGKKPKDASKIGPAAEALGSLKADGFFRGTPKDLGMDKPGWTVEVVLKDKTKHSFNVGSVEKDGALGIQTKGAPGIYSLAKYSAERFLLNPKDY